MICFVQLICLALQSDEFWNETFDARSREQKKVKVGEGKYDTASGILSFSHSLSFLWRLSEYRDRSSNRACFVMFPSPLIRFLTLVCLILETAVTLCLFFLKKAKMDEGYFLTSEFSRFFLPSWNVAVPWNLWSICNTRWGNFAHVQHRFDLGGIGGSRLAGFKVMNYWRNPLGSAASFDGTGRHLGRLETRLENWDLGRCQKKTRNGNGKV